MKRRRLGKTNYEISEIGLGCWQLGGDFGPLEDDTAARIMDKATDLGVNFWDTADVYGGGLSESRIGAYLSDRKDIIVATKVGRSGELFPHSYTKEKLRASLQGSAMRLGAEMIDLAQIHCVPYEVLRDGEIFNWMEDLCQEGLVRFYGASVETIDEALLCLECSSLSTLQIIFNIFRQDAAERLFPAAQQADVGIIVRLPLASGLLSGKFARGQQFSEQDHRNYNRDGAAFSVGETFSGIPFETGIDLVSELGDIKPDDWTLSHLALRWILEHPAVSTIIAGVSRAEQLADNVAAAERQSLPSDLKIDLADFYDRKVRAHVRGEI